MSYLSILINNIEKGKYVINNHDGCDRLFFNEKII